MNSPGQERKEIEPQELREFMEHIKKHVKERMPDINPQELKILVTADNDGRTCGKATVAAIDAGVVANEKDPEKNGMALWKKIALAATVTGIIVVGGYVIYYHPDAVKDLTETVKGFVSGIADKFSSFFGSHNAEKSATSLTDALQKHPPSWNEGPNAKGPKMQFMAYGAPHWNPDKQLRDAFRPPRPPG